MRRESRVTLSARTLQPGALEILECNGQMPSVTGLLSLAQAGAIPLYNPPRLDERQLCAYAIEGQEEAALDCPCLVADLEPTYSGRPVLMYCSLNGREVKSPCVFDEPRTADVWAEIRAYRERWGQNVSK